MMVRDTILYHITSTHAATLIRLDGVVKPGPKSVWVDRKPTGYVRAGGKVWLCTAEKVPWVVEHLKRQGKVADTVIAVKVDCAFRYRPIRGIYYTDKPQKDIKWIAGLLWHDE